MKRIIENLRDEELAKLSTFNVNAVHGDHVVALPEGAQLHASSERTENEIYTIADRVLCLQCHPELNAEFMN